MASRQGVWRLYAQGLRFDGAPEYDAGGGRIKPLMRCAQTSMVNDRVMSLRAAIALLIGQMPRLEGQKSTLEPDAVALELQKLLPDHSITVESETNLDEVFKVIQQRGVGLVAMTKPGRSLRWGVVVGCEGRWSGEAPLLTSAHAILVLDWSVPLVWGSGHNVRLERELGAEEWIATTMEGGRWRVLLGPAVWVRAPSL